jgi:hypothetical protein
VLNPGANSNHIHFVSYLPMGTQKGGRRAKQKTAQRRSRLKTRGNGLTAPQISRKSVGASHGASEREPHGIAARAGRLYVNLHGRGLQFWGFESQSEGAHIPQLGVRRPSYASRVLAVAHSGESDHGQYLS